jgi:hypothetical protein
MRKLRILFIIAGLVGAFYLNGAGYRVQASPGAVSVPICYYYEVWGADGCLHSGYNCDDGAGFWCWEECRDGDWGCISW